MKKFLLSLVALTLLAVGNAFATQVEVTMNAKSKLIKSLVNTATNESVEVGEPDGTKYTFDVPDGSIVIGNPGLIRRSPGATLNYINNTILFDEYNVSSSGVKQW